MRDASYDPSVPFESLTDWVSYGDAVVVATVSDEVPADPTDELGAIGWPEGQSVVIDERLWQHPSAPVPSDTIKFTGGLLVVEPGARPSLTLRLASVGAQYLVALGRYGDRGWMPVAPMLEVLDDRVDPNVAGTYPFADALAGLEIAEIESILSDTAPNPVAEANRPADPAARFAATINENSPATTASSPTPNSPSAPPTSSSPTVADTVEPAQSPCTEFEPRYLGQGLSASLPDDARFTGGEGTADPGPVPAGWAADFELAEGSITIGRRMGVDIVPEPGFSQRVEGEMVVFVKSDNDALRACVLASVTYNRARDQQDD